LCKFPSGKFRKNRILIFKPFPSNSAKTFVILPAYKYDFQTNPRDMSKIMTVDILSSIKGAQPSEAVSQLFEVIKNAHPTADAPLQNVKIHAVSISSLRADVVEESTDLEKEIIRENFPKEKDGYLVVAKVIED
jgi:Asp-tRNA(Asn)/Glu-tRNA(Gln) amidotransferase C subunit